MKDSNNRRNQQQFRKGTMLEAYGGHIVRSTGRKDRHSKVYTAKGLRDRRVRLSAHTAIQFYDVQDRLGYDRPSKAIDWLIQNAKAAIDQLAEFPRGHNLSHQYNAQDQSLHANETKLPMAEVEAFASMSYDFIDSSNNTSFFSSSLDNNGVTVAAKSFPVATATVASSSSIKASTYQNYFLPAHLLRTSSLSHDLRLSLQSFGETVLQNHDQHNQSNAPASSQQTLLSGGTNSTPGPNGGLVQNEMLASWNMADACDSGGGTGFVYNVALPPHAVPLLSQSKLFAQREPLQSSNQLPLHSWMDSTAHPALISAPAGLLMSDSYGGFSGFTNPARGEEEHDGIPQMPHSDPSASR